MMIADLYDLQFIMLVQVSPIVICEAGTDFIVFGIFMSADMYLKLLHSVIT